MQLIHTQNDGRQTIHVAVEKGLNFPIWEFYVSGVTQSGDARCVPSVGMAFELLGADPRPVLEAYPMLADEGPRVN